jgi:ribosomal protein S18 acetylase RimI-like enzyme
MKLWARLNVEPARRDDWSKVFDLTFAGLTEADRAERSAKAIRLLETGEFDADGVRVVCAGGRPVGAILCTPVPGAGSLIWPPTVRPDVSQRSALEDALVRDALVWLRQRGSKVVQAMLASEERELAAPLERNGVRRRTRLWYLQHHLQLPTAAQRAPRRLQLQSLSEAGEAAFGQVLARTYAQTRDCPELDGVRTIAEILDGHRHQGRFDPEHWQIAFDASVPIGVLIVADATEQASCEIVYIGVVPEARRRGFGLELTRHALEEAHLRGLSSVTLSVDERNGPAWELYRKLGFEQFDSREVYLGVVSELAGIDKISTPIDQEYERNREERSCPIR